LTEIRETGKAQRGNVCIACIPTAAIQFLPRIMQEYSVRYPTNRIKILDHLSPNVTEAVLRREAEFGINISESQHPELAITRLVQDKFILICRDDHPLAKRRKLSWKQLQSHSLIFAASATANRTLLDLALGAHNFNLQPYYEVQRSSTAIGLVAQGVAAAVVPLLAIQIGTYRNIRAIPLIDPIVSRTLVLISRKKAILSPAARALYDLIKVRGATAL
jgi:DNA-binding transcriptional LysR family regulator